MDKVELEVHQRVPLGKWREDLAKIAGEWNGDTDSNTKTLEERSQLAERGIELIEELNKVLNDLDYA